jgi:hypothetical protein
MFGSLFIYEIAYSLVTDIGLFPSETTVLICVSRLEKQNHGVGLGSTIFGGVVGN